MDTAEIAALVTDAVIAALGDDATYYPTIGIPTAVQVFIRRGTQLVDGLGITDIQAEGRLIEIAVSSLLISPQAGDAIRVGTENWRVRAVRPLDPANVVWNLDCVPDDQ